MITSLSFGDIMEKLKNLDDMYELIETMKINENKSINNITSESIDGYSVSYGETSTQEENKMYNDIVRTYLKYCKTPDGVHYLYCGV